MSEIIDLDALIPQSVVIKFGDQNIEVKPPSIGEVLKLGSLGQKLEKADTLPDGELEILLTDLVSHIEKCIPELAGKQLNTAQILKLVGIISQMSVPPDVQELDKKGITVGDPKAPQG